MRKKVKRTVKKTAKKVVKNKKKVSMSKEQKAFLDGYKLGAVTAMTNSLELLSSIYQEIANDSKRVGNANVLFIYKNAIKHNTDLSRALKRLK